MIPSTLAAGSGDATLFVVLAALLGLVIGSFLNVVIARLPVMMERTWHRQCAELAAETAAATAATATTPAATAADPQEMQPFNLIRPRSRCPHCSHTIAALDNIPIVSWLLLKGRCRSCKQAISWRYPLVEALTAGLFALAAATWGPTLWGGGAMLFCAALVTLAAIDLDTQLLPDDITLPLLWAGLLVSLIGGPTRLEDALIGAMLGYLALWSVYWLFKLVTGKEGMGYGDFKLLAAIGAWLGWTQLPLVILLSAGAGSLWGGFLVLRGQLHQGKPMPFGPWLAIAGIISIFWGSALIHAYLRL